jgi:hypothetical protein
MIEYIPGLAGVPATESSISSIDGKKRFFLRIKNANNNKRIACPAVKLLSCA